MLEIQAASMADANILSDLERKIFNYDVITLERMRYLLKSKSAVVVKAGRAGLVLGSMILLTRKNSSVLRIYSLGVLKEARRYGLGKKLLRYAEGYGVEKKLQPGSPRTAHRKYSSFDFLSVGRLQSLWPQGSLLHRWSTGLAFKKNYSVRSQFMIHPATEVRFINREKGYGLFATRFIPQGSLTWVRDQLDREISPNDLQQYDKMVQEAIINYSYRNRYGNFIFCWDNTRYMNHDCNPNTCITPYDLEMAIRDIHKGEEVTNHYGMLNIIEPFSLPNSDDKIIYPNDLLTHGRKWDQLLRQAFPHLTRVDQPLRPLISDTQWTMLEQISKGEQEMESVMSCYFDGLIEA